MLAWNKIIVGGAISVAALGSTTAYAYACGHRPPHHWPPHHTTTTKHTTTTPAPTTTTTAPTTTTSTIPPE